MCITVNKLTFIQCFFCLIIFGVEFDNFKTKISRCLFSRSRCGKDSVSQRNNLKRDKHRLDRQVNKEKPNISKVRIMQSLY